MKEGGFNCSCAPRADGQHLKLTLLNVLDANKIEEEDGVVHGKVGNFLKRRKVLKGVNII